MKISQPMFCCCISCGLWRAYCRKSSTQFHQLCYFFSEGVDVTELSIIQTDLKLIIEWIFHRLGAMFHFICTSCGPKLIMQFVPLSQNRPATIYCGGFVWWLVFKLSAITLSHSWNWCCFLETWSALPQFLGPKI